MNESNGIQENNGDCSVFPVPWLCWNQDVCIYSANFNVHIKCVTSLHIRFMSTFCWRVVNNVCICINRLENKKLGI